MNRAEQRRYLLTELLAENPQYSSVIVPDNEAEQWRMLRSLWNIRPPKAISPAFLQVQDDFLQGEIRRKGITRLSDLTPVEEGIYLWQGDITTLACDGIVNAANSQMLGCFCPCHGCIDNAIHTFAGVQLRLECAEQMERQGHPEKTGRAKITKAYNLPSRFVIHTVGPIVSHRLTKTHCEQLKSCYRSCLTLAMEHGLENVAFCCISTGEFHFPNDRAADIAVETVRAFQQQQREHGQKEMKVIFNVFQDYDYKLYQDRLGRG